MAALASPLCELRRVEGLKMTVCVCPVIGLHVNRVCPVIDPRVTSMCYFLLITKIHSSPACSRKKLLGMSKMWVRLRPNKQKA